MSKRIGTLDFGDGVYEGELLGEIMHGRGAAKFVSGDEYVGEWANDMFHGQGMYRWADGDTYTGEYYQEKQHGMGTLQDVAGTYSGHWVEDARDGWGKQVYKTGDVYEGEWKQDVKHGRGKTVHADGSWYEGEWESDAQHGKGITRNINGDIYEGEFLNCFPNGKGVYRWLDGGSFVGYFVNGVRHGEGCERKANGTWVAGHWINGEHDKSQPMHFIDPVQAAAQEEILLSGLSLDSALKPLPIEQLKSQGALTRATKVVPPPAPAHSSGKTTDTVPTAPHSAISSLTDAVATVPHAGDAAHPGSSSTAASPPAPTTTNNNNDTSQSNNLNASTSGSASGYPSSSALVFQDSDFIDFHTMKLLGKGSFGAVYECALRTGKVVCVKQVELGTFTDIPGELGKLHNEIGLMKRMKHPNIVQYYGSNEDKQKNRLNIFMEYVTGGSLNHFIKRFKQIPRDTLRQWAFQLVCGVKYLHDNHIVHRDIKGDNILVTLEGVLKLADFGCSKQIDNVCSRSHGCQTMVGTPYWMAPEVIKCEGEGYGFKSDIWSVGCTVVEMVTGKPPWPECNSMWAAVYKIANSTGLPTEIPNDLGPEMMDFLEQCFERNPDKRASVDDLLNHPWIREFSQK